MKLKKIVIICGHPDHETFTGSLLDAYEKGAIEVGHTVRRFNLGQLSFDPIQSNYLRSQPLHHSQKVLKESEKVFIFSVDLVINYELKSLLQSFGDKVKVLEPKSLADEMKAVGLNMAARYS